MLELVKQPGRTLGFSIAGGRGSTPAYEDVDEVCRYMYVALPLCVLHNGCVYFHIVCFRAYL